MWREERGCVEHSEINRSNATKPPTFGDPRIRRGNADWVDDLVAKGLKPQCHLTAYLQHATFMEDCHLRAVQPLTPQRGNPWQPKAAPWVPCPSRTEP